MAVDWTKPIQTRDGRPARLLGVLKGIRVGHVVAYEKDTSEFVLFRQSDGHSMFDVDSPSDIINVPPEPKRFVRWVNVYSNQDLITVHYDRVRADSSALGSRSGCRKIIITEGYDDETPTT